MKPCAICHTPMVRGNQRPGRFARRIYCSNACRLAGLRSMVAVLDATKREMACVDCGAKVIRGSRARKAVCPACVSQHREDNQATYRARLRRDARRYRVLMTALGWDDFDALMGYLRTVPWAMVGNARRRNLREAA